MFCVYLFPRKKQNYLGDRIMSTVRGVKDRRFKFVQLLNSMFEDTKLSLKAKGFIGYCLTKKDDWVFHMDHLVSVLKEGDKAIYAVITECIEQGYAYRYQTRDDKGRATPIEFIISDSKEEIALIKQEKESDPNFKKFLPEPQKGEADSPQPEKGEAVFTWENRSPIYSNTNSSNTREQQQQPAAASFYKELKDIDIPAADKIEITKTYPIERVRYALLWLAKNDKPLTKGVAAALKWACKVQPEIPKPKKADTTPVNPEGFNKCYYREVYRVAHQNGIRLDQVGIQDGNEYLETEHDKIFFKDKGFLEQIANYLRKKSIDCRNVFDMIKVCQNDLVKQLC